MALKANDGEEAIMKKYVSLAVLIAFVGVFNFAFPAQSAESAAVNSYTQAPPAANIMSLTLDCGSNPQAGQLAIADVLTYKGANPTITPPIGWSLIREDISPTTRQSLYSHVVDANDPSTDTWLFSEPVDAQGAVLTLDNVAQTNPVDTSSGNTGHSGTLTADSVGNASDGNLVLAFYATDFAGTGLFGIGGIGTMIPTNSTVILAQKDNPLEYWVIVPGQSIEDNSAGASCVTPQLFNWVAAEVALKSAR